MVEKLIFFIVGNAGETRLLGGDIMVSSESILWEILTQIRRKCRVFL